MGVGGGGGLPSLAWGGDRQAAACDTIKQSLSVHQTLWFPSSLRATLTHPLLRPPEEAHGPRATPAPSSFFSLYAHHSGNRRHCYQGNPELPPRVVQPSLPTLLCGWARGHRDPRPVFFCGPPPKSSPATHVDPLLVCISRCNTSVQHKTQDAL